MDYKGSNMGSDLQNDVRRPYSNGSIERKHSFKHNGDAIRHNHWHNRFKMAEAIKLLDALGLTVYILAILANLGNVISITMGVIGIAWAVIKTLKMYEDYIIRKIERKEKQKKK